MHRLFGGAFAASIAFSGMASAAGMTPGLYGSYGVVSQATSQCSAVGLSQGSGNFSEFKFPGDGKAGFTLYTPSFGVLQLCNGFAAVPAGGLNGYTSNAQCTTYGTVSFPAETVNFKFTSTMTDANSGVGSTTVTIPVTDPVGGGCTATVNTAVVRTGK